MSEHNQTEELLEALSAEWPMDSSIVERVMQEIRKIDLAAPSFLEPGRLVTTSMYRSVDA